MPTYYPDEYDNGAIEVGSASPEDDGADFVMCNHTINGSGGVPCGNRALPGTTVCKKHGGEGALAMTGVGNHQFKHGRYSKKLPKRLLANYEVTQTDAELLAMSDEIRLIDVLIAETLEEIDSGYDEKMWQKMSDHYDKFREALVGGDARGKATATERMRMTIERGLSQSQARSRLRELIQDRRRIVESEQKRLIAMRTMISSEDAIKMMIQISGIIKSRVRDKEDRNSVLAAINSMILNSGS